MQEVFEKIIKELQEWIFNADVIVNKNEIINHNLIIGETAIEIVKHEADEYNNGWIPVSECLPKEHDSIFARFKGTTKWNDSMFEKISNEVNVTVSDGKGDRATIHAHTVDGMWSCDFLKVNKKYSVIAWKPLPAPYQPKGE